jgi:hypothetical protein
MDSSSHGNGEVCSIPRVQEPPASSPLHPSHNNQKREPKIRISPDMLEPDDELMKIAGVLYMVRTK